MMMTDDEDDVRFVEIVESAEGYNIWNVPAGDDSRAYWLAGPYGTADEAEESATDRGWRVYDWTFAELGL